MILQERRLIKWIFAFYTDILKKKQEGIELIGNWLLCDFHIHTSLSDGSVDLSEVVDSFGSHGFDVVSITDHVMDTHTEERLLKRGGRYPGVRRENFYQYLHTLWTEAVKQAIRKNQNVSIHLFRKENSCPQ
jgi:hypothetical protein